jgi:hypothetical protein
MRPPIELPMTALHSTNSMGFLLSSKGVLLDIPLAASPGTANKLHLPQQACSKGGAAFPRQLTGPHNYPHLRQNSGSNQFPQGFPFGGAHTTFLHAKSLALGFFLMDFPPILPAFLPNHWPVGFPPQEVFPFYFLIFPTFLLIIISPIFCMLLQACEDPQVQATDRPLLPGAQAMPTPPKCSQGATTLP